MFFYLFSCCYKSNPVVEETFTFSAIYQDKTLESNFITSRND